MTNKLGFYAVLSCAMAAVGLTHAATQAPAVTPVLTICTLDAPFMPFTHPNGSGKAQQAIRAAAAGLPLQLRWVTAPRRRCLADLASNTVQGVVAAYDIERTSYAAYPMRANKPDPQHSVVTVRARFYQLAGAPLRWDGQKFSGIADPLIGVQAGFIYANLLIDQGIRADEGATALAAQFAKLATKRVDAVLAMENEADPLIHEQYAGKIEALSPAFQDIPLYLAVSQPFYRQNTAAVDALWTRLRPSGTSQRGAAASAK